MALKQDVLVFTHLTHFDQQLKRHVRLVQLSTLQHFRCHWSLGIFVAKDGNAPQKGNIVVFVGRIINRCSGPFFSEPVASFREIIFPLGIPPDLRLDLLRLFGGVNDERTLV